MKATRAKQTPERRRAIAQIGKQAQRDLAWERLKIRLKVMGTSEEHRWRMAYEYGKRCQYSRHYRRRTRKAAA